MYDEQIKKLRELASIPEHCENVADCDQCSKEDICLSFTNKRIIEVATQAADAIEELSKLHETQKRNLSVLTDELMRHWIPVTEQLPKEEKEIYWCYTNMGIMCECRWTNNRWGLGESDKWGWNIMDVPQYQKVTHWMPLPEPPKEEVT